MVSLKNPYLILPYMLLGSVVPLFFALFVQYVQHYPPCEFCLLQRYPYLMVLAFVMFTIPGLQFPHWVRLQGLFAALAWLTTSAIGFYHFGIEQKWISYSGECVSGAPTSSSIADLKSQIEAAPLVSCAETGWSMLGISMPLWNALLGLALALGMFYLLRKNRNVQ